MSKKYIHKIKSDINKEEKKSYHPRFFITINLITLMLEYMLFQSGCIKMPVSSAESKAGSEIATSVVQTLNSNTVTQTAEITPTPLLVSSLTNEPTAIEMEKYLDTDFTITPTIWKQISSGGNLMKDVAAFLYKPEEFDHQYQLWIEDSNKVIDFGTTFSYIADSYDQYMIWKMGTPAKKLGLEYEDTTEIEVIEQALESSLYLDSQYLKEEYKNIKATVLYVTVENGKVIPHSFSNGGIAIYVDNGNVQCFKGNEIPTSLPEEVKTKFLNGYTRVDVNNGVVEGSGKWEW